MLRVVAKDQGIPIGKPVGNSVKMGGNSAKQRRQKGGRTDLIVFRF